MTYGFSVEFGHSLRQRNLIRSRSRRSKRPFQPSEFEVRQWAQLMLPIPIMSTETWASCAELMHTEALKMIGTNRVRFTMHHNMRAPLAHTCCRVNPPLGLIFWGRRTGSSATPRNWSTWLQHPPRIRLPNDCNGPPQTSLSHPAWPTSFEISSSSLLGCATVANMLEVQEKNPALLIIYLRRRPPR